MLLKFKDGATSISLEGDEYTADKSGVVEVSDRVWDRRDKTARLPVEELPRDKKDGKK